MKKVITLLAIVCLLTSCENISNGARVGYIIKFSKKGTVCKTWEGELALTNAGASINTFTFSIDSDENDTLLIKSIQQSMDQGDKVKLVYHEVKWKNWWSNRGETNYFVTDNFVLLPGAIRNQVDPLIGIPRGDRDSIKAMFSDTSGNRAVIFRYVPDSIR